MHLLAAVAFTTSPSNLIWIAGAVGFLLPHAIAILNQAHWSPGLKAVVAFAACLVAAVVICFTKGQLDFHNWAATAGVVFAMARVSYSALWKPTGINDSLELSTTVSKTPNY